MATGKERGFKDWKGSKNFRRSARSYTESDTITRGAKRKNTRKYCKGVKGRKHTLELYNRYTWSHGYKCVKCNKQFWFSIVRDEFDFVEVKYGPLDH